jgi:membrane protein DedA with SNARE-associated domain
MEVADINAKAKYILYSGIFLATTAISIYLMIRYWQEIAELQNYGYLGIFVIAFIAGSSIPTPISYLLITFTFGGIPTASGALHPAFVGVAGGVGAGLGGTLVFLLGRGGRRFFPGLKHYDVDEAASNSLFSRFFKWAQNKGGIVVFLMSAMLNPVFAPMALAMGAMKYSRTKFLLLCVSGNILKAMVVAYVGYIGLGTILRALGVS